MTKDDSVAQRPGSFYRATSPNAPPAKADGAPVAVGDVTGVIEVMKTFVQVTAPVAGARITVLVDNEEPVMPEQIVAEVQA